MGRNWIKLTTKRCVSNIYGIGIYGWADTRLSGNRRWRYIYDIVPPGQGEKKLPWYSPMNRHGLTIHYHAAPLKHTAYRVDDRVDNPLWVFIPCSSLSPGGGGWVRSLYTSLLDRLICVSPEFTYTEIIFYRSRERHTRYSISDWRDSAGSWASSDLHSKWGKSLGFVTAWLDVKVWVKGRESDRSYWLSSTEPVKAFSILEVLRIYWKCFRGIYHVFRFS